MSRGHWKSEQRVKEKVGQAGSRQGNISYVKMSLCNDLLIYHLQKRFLHKACTLLKCQSLQVKQRIEIFSYFS